MPKPLLPASGMQARFHVEQSWGRAGCPALDGHAEAD